jgi:hypothetical protein
LLALREVQHADVIQHDEAGKCNSIEADNLSIGYRTLLALSPFQMLGLQEVTSFNLFYFVHCLDSTHVRN